MSAGCGYCYGQTCLDYTRLPRARSDIRGPMWPSGFMSLRANICLVALTPCCGNHTFS